MECSRETAARFAKGRERSATLSVTAIRRRFLRRPPPPPLRSLLPRPLDELRRPRGPEQIPQRRRHRRRAAAAPRRGHARGPRRADGPDRGDGRQGSAQPPRDGPRRLPRVLPPRPEHVHGRRDHVRPGRPRGPRVPRRVREARHLGLFLHHGAQPRREPVQLRVDRRRARRDQTVLPQAPPLDPRRALGARERGHPRLRRPERLQARADHMPRRAVPRDGASAPTKAPRS